VDGSTGRSWPHLYRDEGIRGAKARDRRWIGCSVEGCLPAGVRHRGGMVRVSPGPVLSDLIWAAG
jgi:hypothetical protein